MGIVQGHGSAVMGAVVTPVLAESSESPEMAQRPAQRQGGRPGDDAGGIRSADQLEDSQSHLHLPRKDGLVRTAEVVVKTTVFPDYYRTINRQ